ncbi:MAG: secondary thiamine-phosphate synthase enzyme YjbQ [Candidatus Omnitrophica bacterium]|nr:secondary thiamine-phosphate synthase enzyme YjbQ [Candidatus Omnitrophota bacterium]
MQRIGIKTKNRAELVDITETIQSAASRAKIRDGVCLVFCPHTTAGLTINENADPSVREDIVASLNRMVPADRAYAHSEGNSDSHIKASVFGSSLQIFLEEGRLCLGRWQGVYFCEGDGPRSREVWVKFIASEMR